MNNMTINIDKIIVILSIVTSIVVFFVMYFKILKISDDKGRKWNKLMYCIGASLFALFAVSGYKVSIPLLFAYKLMKYSSNKDKEFLKTLDDSNSDNII